MRTRTAWSRREISCEWISFESCEKGNKANKNQNLPVSADGFDERDANANKFPFLHVSLP